MITLCTVDLEECVRGAIRNRRAPDELGSYALRQRDLELYVITKTHGYKRSYRNVHRYGLSMRVARGLEWPLGQITKN